MIWFELVLNGIFLGSLYALFGLGLSIIFGVMKIANITHGELVIAGAFLAFVAADSAGINVAYLLLPVMAAMFLVGWVLQSVLVNRVLGKDPMPPLLLTFGLSIVTQNAMVMAFGANTRSITTGGMQSMNVELLGMHVGVLPLATTLLAIAVFVGLETMMKRTQLGRNIRATSDDPEIVRIFGVRPKKLFSFVMALSAALAAMAGVLLATRTTFTPFSGAERLLLAFEVVVIGGLGSIWATLLGGILIGTIHVLTFRFDPASGFLYGHLVLLAVLLFKPSGIAGRKVTR
jgi:branched-chain amino acid transport system permease protein